MFDFKSKCWIFHNWEKNYETYKIIIPKHQTHIGGMTIQIPEEIRNIEFLIRTCRKCNNRQRKRMLSEGWDNWKFSPHSKPIIANVHSQISIL